MIGANAIGLELGQYFTGVGSRVTLFDVADRIAPFEEPEISDALTDVLRELGAEVHAPAQIARRTSATGASSSPPSMARSSGSL